MQKLKWFILFVMLCVSIPEICQASVRDSQSDMPSYSTISSNNRSTHLLDSLVSLLHFTASDQNEPIYHLNAYKKSFVLLLIYLKNHDYFLQKSGYPGSGHWLPVDNPGRKTYYVYTLHKIII